MKKKKSLTYIIIAVLILLLLSLCLILVLPKGSNLDMLKKQVKNVSLETCYGYNQTIQIQNANIDYTSYQKIVSYDGINLKIAESTATLNAPGETSTPTTTVSTICYVDGEGYKIEQVEGIYQRTSQIDFAVELALEIKKGNFESFEFRFEKDEDEKEIKENYLFTSKIDADSISKYVTPENVTSLKLNISVKNAKINTAWLTYSLNDGTLCTITTTYFDVVQEFTMPEI